MVVCGHPQLPCRPVDREPWFAIASQPPTSLKAPGIPRSGQHSPPNLELDNRSSRQGECPESSGNGFAPGNNELLVVEFYSPRSDPRTLSTQLLCLLLITHTGFVRGF